MPARVGARPGTGAALETSARFNPEILIVRRARLTFSLSDATGISPTRPALGAPASAPSWAAAAAVGVAGRQWAANAHRGGGRRRPGRSFRGDRRLQANRGAGATGAGHGGSGGVADERSGGRSAGPLAAVIRT